MDIFNILSIAGSFVLAFFTSLLTVNSRLGKIEGLIEGINRRHDDLNSRLDRVEDRNNNFFTNLLLGAKAREEKAPEETQVLLSKFDEFLSKVKPSGNPISQDEINRAKEYRNKIANGTALSVEETNDMLSLLDKVKNDLSSEKEKQEFGAIEAGMLGFAIGLLIVGLLASIGKSE